LNSFEYVYVVKLVVSYRKAIVNLWLAGWISEQMNVVSFTSKGHSALCFVEIINVNKEN